MGGDLHAFVTARCADNEALARMAFSDHNAAEADWEEIWSGAVQVGPHEDLVLTNDSAISRHIVNWNPARVLRRVAADRRILARHRQATAEEVRALGRLWAGACVGCGVQGWADDPVTDDINNCPELRDMAMADDQHPDYRQEWNS